MISAEKAYTHYTTALQLASVGVAGVSVFECHEALLPVEHDGIDYREHVAIIFDVTSSLTEQRKKAKFLSSAANVRQWLFLPSIP